MNDESDLPLLTSIILGYTPNDCRIPPPPPIPLQGDYDTIDSNSLIMKSIDEMMILIDRSPFSIYIERRWIQFQVYKKSETRKYE